MKIYVINMSSAPDRMNYMEQRLGELGLDFERVEAVAGALVPENDLRKFKHYDQMNLGKGEYGCTLSHQLCWEKLVASGEDAALILEDDVNISNRMPQFLQSVKIPQEPCLIRLETFLTSITATGPHQSIGIYKIYEMLSNHAGTAAYIFNLAIARNLLANLYYMKRPIDIELFNPIERTIPYIKVYQCCPAPCAQWMSMEPETMPTSFASSISGSRESEKIGQKSARRASWKKVFLPLYLRLYSLKLAHRGQKRVDVWFA